MNDGYWFGVVPVLAESAALPTLGFARAGDPIGIDAHQIARAGAIGQILHMMGPTGAPLWVLLGLVKAELGDFQKHALRWGVPVSLDCIALAVLTGAVTVS
nr:hypothetical protein [Streptomyces chartreusis]